MKSKIKIFHLWSGIVLGLFLSISAISGALLLHKNTLLQWQYSTTFNEVEKNAKANISTISTIIRKAVSAYPKSQLTMIETPNKEIPFFRVWMKLDNGYNIDYLDGITTQRKLTRNVNNDWLMWLYELHSSLLSGDKGEQILGILAFGFVTLLISGLFVWWPSFKHLKRNLLPPRARRLNPWLYWIHRFLGSLSFPVMLIIILTGMGMVYYTPVQQSLVALLDQQPIQEKPPRTINCPSNSPTVPWEDQLNTVYKTLPEARLIRIHPPKKTNKPVIYRLKHAEEWHQNGRSYVYINPCNNSVIYKHDAREAMLGVRASNLIYPIHSAHIGGSLFKILTTLAAIAIPLLYTTGLFLWIRRRIRSE